MKSVSEVKEELFQEFQSKVMKAGFLEDKLFYEALDKYAQASQQELISHIADQIDNLGLELSDWEQEKIDDLLYSLSPADADSQPFQKQYNCVYCKDTGFRSTDDNTAVQCDHKPK